MTYSPPDPNANPLDRDDIANLTTDRFGGPHYPNVGHHTWGEFAYLAVEAGGYSDLTAIDPYTGNRLWVGGSDTPHEFCLARCSTCGNHTRPDDQGSLVHADAHHRHAAGQHAYDHAATVPDPDTIDCPHKYGGRVGIMSNNQSSRDYFGGLRRRFSLPYGPPDPYDDTVSVYEQLRRLVDVMEASQFLGPQESDTP
jgi:hypothetical protein